MLFYSCAFQSEKQRSAKMIDLQTDLLKYVFQKGKFCYGNDTLYIDNGILIQHENKSILNNNYLRKEWRFDDGTTLVFINEDFLKYPRKYNCVISPSFDYKSNSTVLVEYWQYSDLLSPYFGGKEDSEQTQGNYLIEILSEGEYKILDEHIGLKIEVDK